MSGKRIRSPLELTYRAPNLFRLTHGDQEIEGVGSGTVEAPFLMECGCTGRRMYKHTRGVRYSMFEVTGKLRLGMGGRAEQELRGLVWNLPVLFAVADDAVEVLLSEARAVGAERDPVSGETRIVVEGQLPMLNRAELVLDGSLGLVSSENRMEWGGTKMVLRDEFESFEIGEVGEGRFEWTPPEGMGLEQ